MYLYVMSEEVSLFKEYRRKRKSVYEAKRLNQRYIITKVWLREEVYRKLMELLPKVFDYHRGALSDAVNEAIVMWISAHTSAHIKVNPRPDVREVFREVLQYLVEVYFPIGKLPTIVPRRFIEEAIRYVRKIKDPRSVLNWLRAFVDEGLLKYNTKRFTLKTTPSFEIVAP